TTVSADQKTTTIKINSDTVVDRLETITIDNAGMQKDEVKQYKASGELESQAVVTISDDGLSKTLSSDLDGNGIFELVTTDVTVLNADGSRTETVSKKGIGDALISRTTANVSASGLSKTTSWADTSGNVVRSMSDVTALNADGGTTETLSYFKAGGALESKTVTAVAAHQLSTTVTIDVDGDNNVDKKSITAKQADGSTVQTLSDFGANAVLKDTKKVATSADGLTQTIEYDSDGNGTVDKKTTRTTVLNANGSKTTTVKDIVAGVTKSITLTDVSGDGLTVTTKWDTTGTGNSTTFDKTRTDVTVLNADGSKTQTISNLTGTTLTSRTLVTTSANGQSITTQIDPTGAGSYSQTATDVTVLNANGTKTRTVESKKADGSLISRTTTTISANGLIVASSEERPGFANQTVTDTTTVLADGAIREVVETRDSGGALIGKIVTLTSADKLTVTVDRDGNGDGIVDQRQETVTANSGIQTSVATDFNANGTIKDKSISVVSADGRQTSTIWDLDGNGTIDRQRVGSFTANADGSSTTVMTDANLPNGPLVANTPPGYPNTNLPNSTLASKTTIQTSADGKVKTTSKDINGDGTSDQTETATIDSTGASVSLVTNNETAQKVSNLTPGGVYWTQAIAAKIETTTSADGRTKIAKYDYDGNGVYETVMQSTIQVDGSVVTVVTETNANGTIKAKGTISTSADGLITTLSKDADNNGTYDHTETAVTHADGSITLTRVDLNGSGAMTQTTVDQVTALGSLS
ncbi:beta strand repeat-containing protein, partial [Rhizobium leguminosarum]